MASGTKCFVLNRRSDWEENSSIENLGFEEDTLTALNTSGENGYYISSAFDSLQAETVWHRMRLDAKIPQNTQVKIRIYASDSLYAKIPDLVSYGDPERLLDEYLLDDEVRPQRKVALFDYLGAKTFENPEDIVLFEFKGRYLWICIEVIRYSEELVRLHELKIEFPRICFVDYLPQIYRGGTQKNFFLARFISIFQSLYVDLEDQIDNMPRMFDPKTVDAKFLEWLTEWFSVEDSYIWGEEKLRIFLKNAVKLYKMKGTKQAISTVVKIYMGITPIIVEQFDVVQNDFYESSKEYIENLFGENGYTFSVIIKTDKVISSETYIELIKLINRFKPIDTICNLVILNNEIYLDHHCYLGINSYAARNENIVLDDDSDIPNPVFLTSTQSIQ